MEREAIRRIENWLSEYRDGNAPGSLADRAKLIRGILGDYYGTNRVRLDVICPALGCTKRSLQREFKARYGVSMNDFQESARLARAIWYMKVTPNVKMNALAEEMGYDRLSEFARFFRRKTGLTPRAYLEQVIGGYTQNDGHEENP